MKTPFLAALLAACVSYAAHAEDEILVTAARMAETADETLASVTLISREEIETSQAKSVQELLSTVPGLDLVNNGGLGKATSLFMRGTNSNHLLVLVDGIKVGSATNGSIPFQYFPIEQIEKIEIVRGPRSSLYGSEAIGGVIQIFTRKGTTGFKPYASIGGGSYETHKESFGASGGSNGSWYGLSVSKESTRGFNSCDGVTTAGCFTDEPDNDGYDNLSGSLNAGHRFDNGTAVDFHWLRSEGMTEYDGGFQNETEHLKETLGGSLRLMPMQSWQLILSGGQSLDKEDNLKDGVFSGQFNTRRETASLVNEVSLADGHLLSAGLDYQKDSVDSTTSYAITERANNGIFAQYKGNISAHDLQFSLRRDDNEQFGEHDTGSAAWGYGFKNGVRLVLSYGTAFSAPTFNDLYWPGDPVFGGGGNPNLLPEESESTEMGLSGDYRWGKWGINLYQTQIDNLISGWPPTNVDKALIQGVETSLVTVVAGWQVNTTLSLLDPRDKSGGANHDKLLQLRSQEKLAVTADRDFGRYSLGATLTVEGDRFDDQANTVKVAGYERIDLRAGYRLNKAWLVQGSVENLLDAEYETVRYYNQPDRSAFVTLRYQP